MYLFEKIKNLLNPWIEVSRKWRTEITMYGIKREKEQYRFFDNRNKNKEIGKFFCTNTLNKLGKLKILWKYKLSK